MESHFTPVPKSTVQVDAIVDMLTMFRICSSIVTKSVPLIGLMIAPLLITLLWLSLHVPATAVPGTTTIDI